MDILVLQNETLRLEFDRSNGALVGLTALESGWKILDRPHLGLAFRILLPLPGRRNNPVCGEQQKLSTLQVNAAGTEAVFTWDQLTSQHGGVHPIQVVLTVALTSRQAVYRMTIANRSPLVVENVCCPYIGDISHGAKEDWLESFTHAYGAALKNPIWPVYRSTRGYHGVDHPTQLSDSVHNSGAPMSPFILLRGEDRGLYVGSLSQQYDLVAWHTELLPGFGSSMDSRMPVERQIGGQDVCVRFAAVHFPFILPGETRDLAPVALEAYRGSWEKGVDIYTAWKKSWMQSPQFPAWVKAPHAWQQIQINSPEDELRFQYKDLVEIGKDCAKYGVKAIQLTGWNIGGQDRDNPSHSTDPRLGTFEELKDAIAQVQAMGVKVVLFAKFTWADWSTDWFRRELVQDAIKDPNGDYYVYGGYQYHTLTQLLDVNTRRLIPMCFSSQHYLQVCLDEFKKLVQLGCDGILFDECSWHGQALFCFDTRHGHRYGAVAYENDNLLIDKFEEILAPLGKEFIFAGEACYDMMLQKYHVSYHRSERVNHEPLMRYMSPGAELMTAVPGFNDRNMLNQCLMYRYIPSYEPFNFKGRLPDYPATMAYGRQMESLRLELRDYFWEGEFRGTCEARLLGPDGKKYAPYAVFKNRKDGRLGIVVSNYSDAAEVAVQLSPEDSHNFKRYRLVDGALWLDVAQGIRIPPESAAVII